MGIKKYFWSLGVGLVVGAGLATLLAKRNFNVRSAKIKQLYEKYFMMFGTANQWLKIKQQNKKIKEYFIENGYTKIAIYGMGNFGQRLADELQDSSIEIQYFIDINSGCIESYCEVKNPVADLAPVDAIVVTPIYYYDDIEKELSRKIECPIISLDDILYEL